MPAKRPEKLEIRDIKSRLLNVSQTSYYLLSLTFPQNVIKNLSLNNEQSNNIELLCSNANLPGSSLATHDVTNDYHGVTERMAYRRIYDETFNTTFYVDRGYNVIKAFEGWINYISGVNNKKFDESTKLNADYGKLKNIDLIKPCLKRYLASNVRTKFRKVEADEFIVATLLPVQKFKKQSDSHIFAKSRGMI